MVIIEQLALDFSASTDVILEDNEYLLESIKLSPEQLRYLKGPVIHHPGGWSTGLPPMYANAVPAARLQVLTNHSELEASEVECMIYLYGMVMCGPPTDDYFKVYMYLCKRVVCEIQKREWPLDMSEDTLSGWHMNILKSLASDIRRGVVKNSKR